MEGRSRDTRKEAEEEEKKGFGVCRRHKAWTMRNGKQGNLSLVKLWGLLPFPLPMIFEVIDIAFPVTDISVFQQRTEFSLQKKKTLECDVQPG